eukprot:TRINITY_DN64_c1_g1_i15.p1 TRINITY_DN64_c1_g1~~TRINITY_DN64_c1_g1_i15.p1  ORF type:complete len:603 (+),score=177.75 TRINITY_DN64_c1_g1_i15:75-1883(+)
MSDFPEEDFLEHTLDAIKRQVKEKRPRKTQIRGLISDLALKLDEFEGVQGGGSSTCLPSPCLSPVSTPASLASNSDFLPEDFQATDTFLGAPRLACSPVHQRHVRPSLSDTELGLRIRTQSFRTFSSDGNDSCHLHLDIPSSPSPLTPRSESKYQIRKKIQNLRPTFDAEPLVIAMCGLPGTGKSYTALRIQRHLTWGGTAVRIFNSGDYRREVIGGEQKADFFDPFNSEGRTLREEMARLAMSDLLKYLQTGGQVGIFDATNTNVKRRNDVVKFFREAGIPLNRILWYESICDDDDLIRKTVLTVKCKNQDYTHQDKEKAFLDFMNRRANYEKVYESLTAGRDSRLSYIQNRNVGSVITARNVTGRLPNNILQFTAQLPTVAAPIFLVECDSVAADHVLGDDRELTEEGVVFARKLREWLKKKHSSPCMDEWKKKNWEVWYSTKKRAVATADELRAVPKLNLMPWEVLEELNFGTWEGMHPSKLHSQPEYKQVQADPFFTHFPCGESLYQLTQRLEPVLTHMNTMQTPVVIVSHEHVLRCLLAYCLHKLPEDMTTINMPTNSIFQVHLEASPEKTWLEIYDLKKDDDLLSSTVVSTSQMMR